MLLGPIAHIGFATSVFEAAATSIGAGVVVGGFVAATGAMVGKRSRSEVEDTALRDGYIVESPEYFVCFWIY